MIIDECVLMDSKIDNTHKVELTVLNVTPLRLQLHWAKFWILFNKTAILKLKNLRTGSRAPLIITLITKLFFFSFAFSLILNSGTHWTLEIGYQKLNLENISIKCNCTPLYLSGIDFFSC